MITVRTSPQYVNRVRQDWTANGGVYGDGGVYAVVPSNDPFAQFGPTLDLAFAGVPTDPLNAATLTDYTLNTNFILPEYQVAAQYAIWESGTGLASKNFSDIVTFTRASTATYFDSAGVLQSAAINTARFDYDPSTLALRGLLIEEQRTNSIRNNTMQGAVAGTPGTPPTNWASAATTNGLNRQIVGTGTSNGITYIDVRYSGTTTAGAFVNFTGPEANNFIAASNGQSWTSSAWIAVVGGSTANLTNLSMRTRFSDAGGVELTQAAVDLLTATSTMQRFSIAATASNASTAFVATNFSFQFNNGVAIDITLRIGLPQLELGAFATSVIPTTTTALTRSADVASVNTLSPWFNATEGTLFVSSVQFVPGSAGQLVAAELGDGTLNNIMQVGTQFGLTNFQTIVNTGGVTQATFIQVASTSLTSRAFAYKVNDFAQSVNGAAAIVDTAGTVPTVTSLGVGMRTNNASQLNGYLRRITYYPRRLANADLQTLTA